MPKYESAGGSVAVVSDSVGPSPIDTTNAGSGKIYYEDLICDN